jgi:hypothetical protein
MALNGIGASATRRPSTLSRSADDWASPAEPRALVPVPAVDPNDSLSRSSTRPAAPFLAQLIATERGEPQTCERRRAAPEVAARAYSAAARLRLDDVTFRNG